MSPNEKKIKISTINKYSSCAKTYFYVFLWHVKNNLQIFVNSSVKKLYIIHRGNVANFQRWLIMDYPKRFIKKGVNLVYFRPRALLSYLPDDLKKTICAALDVESLEDDALVFDYDCIQDCYSVSKSFEVVVTVKGEV